MPRTTLTLVIRNRLGLHARPAMSFVDTAGLFACDVQVKRADGDEWVDGKSIMQMMMLAATQGTVLDVVCDGADAEQAAARLKSLVESGFDEE